MPARSIFSPRLPQAGRVGDFHGPAVHGGLHADDVAGGARRAVNDRPLVTGNRIDQAALAHVGLPGHDDLPRPDEMQAGGGVGQEGLDLLPGRFVCAGLQGRLDLFDGPPQRTSILVEENGGRPRGAGFGQGQSGGGGKRVGLLVGGPFLPGDSPATAADENLFDAGDRRQSRRGSGVRSPNRNAG